MKKIINNAERYTKRSSFPSLLNVQQGYYNDFL